MKSLLVNIVFVFFIQLSWGQVLDSFKIKDTVPILNSISLPELSPKTFASSATQNIKSFEDLNGFRFTESIFDNNNKNINKIPIDEKRTEINGIKIGTHNFSANETTYYYLFFVLLMLVLLKKTLSTYISYLFKTLHRKTDFSSRTTHKTTIPEIGMFFTNLLFIIIGGIYIGYSLEFIFHLQFSNSLNYFLLGIILVAIYTTVKYIVFKFIGWVTSEKVAINEYLITLNNGARLICVALLILFLVALFTPLNVNEKVFRISFFAFIILYVYRYFFAIRIIQRKIFPNFLSFLLLFITLEIMPYILIFKFLFVKGNELIISL